jgi:hypothetical protein
MSDNKGLGRFFKGDDMGDSTSSNSGSKNESEKTIAELQARITELEGSSGRNSLIDLDEDQLTQIAAEDAAVIIRAARLRAGKLIEQATATLQQAESEREQIRASSELDARQTREAANVDARKLRAEATATLETARDQAAQLLEATQNDADSQSAENQKLIAKLLDDATRRSNDVVNEAEQLKSRVDKEVEALRSNVDKEIQNLRTSTDNEIAQLLASANKNSADQIAAAQAEAKRLQTEAVNSTQTLLASVSADARAIAEEASRNSAATIAEAQAKLAAAQADAARIASEAKSAAEQVVRVANETSMREANVVRAAALKYRDEAAAAADAHRVIVNGLNKEMSDLRTQWFDAQAAMTHASNQVGQKFTEAELAVSDVMSKVSDSRAKLDDTFKSLAGDISTNSKADED